MSARYKNFDIELWATAFFFLSEVMSDCYEKFDVEL